ncbi:MAG: DUF4198 domain-containing protein [Cyclobacteriaceae bacterium]|jgi:uncharacterized GH25 family protein
MKKAIMAMGLLALGAVLQSHEFWLEPKKFRFAVGEVMNIDFRVGENFQGELWDMKRHKAEKVTLFGATGPIDLTKAVKATKNNHVSYKFTRAGTHLVAMQSNAAFIKLAGTDFNAYLKEDGIEDVLAQRKDANLQDTVREFYTRFAKLLVQVGSNTDNTYMKKAGLEHEIIPLLNPYALKAGDYMKCQVLLNGKARPHALVKVWSSYNGTTFLQNIYTENDGTVTFPIGTPGRWMVSSVAMSASSKPEADYESKWASLVFEIQ